MNDYGYGKSPGERFVSSMCGFAAVIGLFICVNNAIKNRSLDPVVESGGVFKLGGKNYKCKEVSK